MALTPLVLVVVNLNSLVRSMALKVKVKVPLFANDLLVTVPLPFVKYIHLYQLKMGHRYHTLK